MDMSALQAATEAHLQTYQGDLAAYTPPSGCEKFWIFLVVCVVVEFFISVIPHLWFRLMYCLSIHEDVTHQFTVPSGHGGLVFAEGAITAVQATVGAWINET